MANLRKTLTVISPHGSEVTVLKPGLGQVIVIVSSSMLVWNCTAARTASTALGNRQEPVSSVLDYTAAVFGDCGLDGLCQQRSQFGMRSLFVDVHKPRVASHVSGQYRRQPALDPPWPLLHHGTDIQPVGQLYEELAGGAILVLRQFGRYWPNAAVPECLLSRRCWGQS
jgi:hypothetical protein